MQVKKPWGEFRDVAWSLFRWNLGLFAVILIPVIIITVIAVLVFSPVITSSGWTHTETLMCLGLIFMGVAFFVPILYVWFYLCEFIAPIMYIHRCTASSAWTYFRPAFKEHTGSILLYPLFRALLSTALVMVLLIFCILTCCIGFIPMLIPYINAVFLLPLTLFLTAYGLEYLRQFGPGYDIFAQSDPEPELLAD